MFDFRILNQVTTCEVETGTENVRNDKNARQNMEASVDAEASACSPSLARICHFTTFNYEAKICGQCISGSNLFYRYVLKSAQLIFVFIRFKFSLYKSE